MTNIDWPTLINWLVTAAIGFVFGGVTAWLVYRFERRRDDIAWEREKVKLDQQFRQEKELLELQFAQKLQELREELERQANQELRDDILKGTENPVDTIKQLEKFRAIVLAGEAIHEHQWGAYQAYSEYRASVIGLAFRDRLRSEIRSFVIPLFIVVGLLLFALLVTIVVNQPNLQLSTTLYVGLGLIAVPFLAVILTVASYAVLKTLTVWFGPRQ